MSTFGKQCGGGRRIASRQKLSFAAVVSTIQSSTTAELVDVSSSGARLKGAHRPAEGTLVSLRLDTIEAFGVVAWREEDICGVAFDEPLSRAELSQLRRQVTIASVRWRSVDEQLASQDWCYGSAR
jgi:PilZ domain